MLKSASLVKIKPGIAGAELARRLSDITLFDVYKAVNVEGAGNSQILS
ncbi:YwnA1 [Paenibacillus terrae HPL-003]|uniref:YwnA1 n=1 Tax=Paenibacillus terrae (strain HPL-003) TaxID=985665 RepID=G7VYI1_PAETH|nr:YwnA1 [Paenibacillus terrae HPL-003]